MATKKATLARQKEMNKKKYLKECDKLRWFYLAALILLVIGLVLYLVPWAQNYSSSADVIEQKGSGWTYIFATLSNSYSSGTWDLLYIFYIYAEGYTVALGVVTVLSLVALICSAVFHSLTLFAKKNRLVYGALASQIAFFVLLLTAMIIAILYNVSGMYVDSASPTGSGYCDPAQCTMYTLIYIPLVVSLAGMILDIIAAVRYTRAAKLLKSV